MTLKKRNHLLSFGTLIFFGLLFMASLGERKATKEITLAVPQYSFIPSDRKTPGSAGLSLLLINPRYATTFQYSSVKVFTEFSKAMSADIDQALTAKGYYIRGPYDTYDEVVYGDKKETDLMLEIQIIPDIDISNVNSKQHVRGYGDNAHYTYTYDGSIVISGKVNLTVSEPMTRQKMWVKSVPMAQKTVVISSVHEYVSGQATNSFITAMTNDAGLVNPMVNVMEDYYKTVLKTAWVHLDPSELQPLKKSVEEIRKNSNLIQH